MTFKVLVFNEPGICPDSIDGLKRDLHLFLSPNYEIGDVDQAQLRFGKWVHTCALLVLPHYSDIEAYTCLGQDLEATKQICDFVHNGGSFLGIGLGAFFASAKANWDGRTIWQEPLALWPGTSAGPWSSSGDCYAHEFFLDIDGSPCHCHLVLKEGGQFEGFEGEQGTYVLARYNDNESVAAIHYVCVQRNVVLWHARLECAVTAQVMKENGVRDTDEKIEVIHSLPMNRLNIEIYIACRTRPPGIVRTDTPNSPPPTYEGELHSATKITFSTAFGRSTKSYPTSKCVCQFVGLVYTIR